MGNINQGGLKRHSTTSSYWQHHTKRQERDGEHQGGLKRHSTTSSYWQHHTKRQERDGEHQGGLIRDRYIFKLLATLDEETGKGGGT